MSGHQMTVDEVKKHVRGYYIVFMALLCLTAVTVGLAYLHLPFHIAVCLALLVATTKAGLVALYFMHLVSEKQIIYSVLSLTGVLFVFLMAISFYL